ncbi:hypothetical protein [Nocardia sp. NBC_01327]|uniref:hypothetical protein n=1 Tax=Nocardia sp. NBC_01327 TaxID=2903593 RepID=UPI002E0DEDB9|nr:hypothetical protein OG326_23295 [Nocardia sp. NBC_01327]
MTSAEKNRRPAVVAAIRAIAALTVVGSAAAVTTLTVRADDHTTTTVVAREQTTTTTSAASNKVEVAPAPLAEGGAAPGAVAPGGANAAVPLGQAPNAAAPIDQVPGAAVPLGQGGAPAASVPLGQGTAPNASVPLGGATSPNASVPLGGGTAPNASVPLNQVPGQDGSVPLAAGNPFATRPVESQPACPLGWPAPKQQGGLASLIGLAPLAGPFSSEAFALGSVYQPILQLAGPVLAEIAPVITQNQPLIDPIIANVQAVEAVVLQAILPYYGPYRAQLIAAEGDFAKTLAPILDHAYNSEAASCLVAWQGQIIDQAKGGHITVASLAHPGTVVELGPED